MEPSSASQPIREEDVEARAIRRRAFLGRFGVAAGVAGMMGFAAGCAGASGDACDSDEGDPVLSDSDPTDAANPNEDTDAGDPCDTD